MKQLNHSPEAAAAVLGVSLKVAHERIAWLRQQGTRRSPVYVAPTTAPSGYVRLKTWKPGANPI